MAWRPATKTYALEMFEVPCRADVCFYGSWGEEADAYAGEGEIAFECRPEDRDQVIKMLSELLDLMKKAKE